MLEGKTLLLVEDEEFMIESYKFKFSARDEVKNTKAIIKTNSKDAVASLETDNPDLVYLDLSLGESSNPEGLDILKKFGNKFNIIIVSAYPEYEEQCRTLGAKGYLVKPVDFNKMMKLGEDILKSNHIQQRT